MKKTIAKILCLILISTLTLPVAQASTSERPEDAEASLKMSTIESMTDEQFDNYITNYLYDASKNSIANSEVVEELATLDIELSEIFQPQSRSISSASGVSMSSYAVKRAHDGFYRVYGMATFEEKEYSPAVEDILSVVWDDEIADYYATNAGPHASFRDGSHSDEGIVLFNVDDSAMFQGDFTYGVAYVIPKEKAVLNISTTLLHTYNTTTMTWTGSASISYKIVPSGSASFELSGSTSGKSIPFSADNKIFLDEV